MGEPAGFGGRALGDDGPKYKNSPENPIYQKSRLLYGLNWAKAEIVARGEVVVCEGYTDVMAFALAGVPHAVATCGTALTDDHVQLLKNLARKVVLAYDADSAGQGAAEKWYRWEQEFEIQVRVADLPAGRDPADVWRDDPARSAARGRTGRTVPPVPHRPAVRDRGPRDARGPSARAGEAAAAIVAEHPSDLVRDQYAMQLAGRLQIDVDRLREAIGGRVGRPAGSGPADAARTTAGRDRATGRAPRGTRRRPRRAGRWCPVRERSTASARGRRPPRGGRVAVGGARAGHRRRLARCTVAARSDGARRVRVPRRPRRRSRTRCSPPTGRVRELLERLAVEEPDAGEEDDRIAIGARVMVNTVAPRADDVIARMLDAGDDRVVEVKAALDRLRHARDFGDWPTARDAARELLGWIGASEGSPSSGLPRCRARHDRDTGAESHGQDVVIAADAAASEPEKVSVIDVDKLIARSQGTRDDHVGRDLRGFPATRTGDRATRGDLRRVSRESGIEVVDEIEAELRREDEERAGAFADATHRTWTTEPGRSTTVSRPGEAMAAPAPPA